MGARGWILAAFAVSVVILSGCTAERSAGPRHESLASTPNGPSERPAPTSAGPAAGSERSAEPQEHEGRSSQPTVRPVSVPGLAAQRMRGDRLRLGAVRERTADYTSYD